MENDHNFNYQEVQNAVSDPNKSVMTMGDWVITLIVNMVPCVNIIMMLIWAFGNGNENRKNFCRANLIIMAVSSVLGFILYVTVFASIITAMSY